MKMLLCALFSVWLILPVSAGLDALFYHPAPDRFRTPADDGCAFEQITFPSTDGTALSGWFIPAQQQKALGTVIHFHGNAQNMSAHYAFVSWLPKSGFNLFVFDYRGYGASEGRPSREGVYQDSVAAIEYIKSRTDIDQAKLIIFGQSIGGANALAAVGSNAFEGIVGVVSDSAFSTYKSVAAEHAGWLKPFAYLFISNRYSPEKYVQSIAPTPLIIIHGTRDRVASVHHAERLFRAAQEPKELWLIEGGEHTSALGPDINTYAPRLCEKFKTWTAD